MLQKIRQYPPYLKHVLLNAPAVSDSIFLYVSNMTTAAVGFLASIIVARHLGPAQFGIITAYNSIVLTLVGFTDFGLGTGLIKFTAPLLRDDRKASAPYFKFVFYSEFAIGLLLLVLGLSFTSGVAHFFGQSLTPSVVRLAVLGASISSTVAYVGAAFSAHKKFKLNAVYSMSVALSRLGLIAALLFSHNLSLGTVIFVYLAMSFIQTGLGFAIVPKDYLQKVERKQVLAAGRQIFKFSGWLTLTFIITSIAGRLDFFFLYKLRGATTAGVYAVALQLAMVYSILIGAVSTVLTPYISEKVSPDEKLSFLKKTLPLALLGALVLSVSGFVAPLVIHFVFGSKYVGATGPLRILAINYGVNALLIPITLMYIPLGQVKVGTFISIAQLGLSFVLYPILILRYGASGAAITILSSALLALIIYPIILQYLLKRERSLQNA